MPDHLKSGLENLSYMNLSSVRVHHNSSKPAQLNALAYTQGQDIHLGPGQEKHLPHEGWHAVQQMQGRVKPTMQAKGVSINDEEGLEREADVMGAKTLQMARSTYLARKMKGPRSTSIQKKGEVVQLVLPGIIASMGAAEWIAAGALGFVVAQNAVASASGDITYKFGEMEGVLLPDGGSDVAAYRRQHPNGKIFEATHYLAVWFGSSGRRRMGIKFGITFLGDGNALGNISLSIIDTYDIPGWGGNVDVNITQRSISAGIGSVRFTVNMGTKNSWFVPDATGSALFILRANGDLNLTRTTDYVWHEIG